MSYPVLPVRRALISVSNKEGLLELVTFLHRHHVEIISTGGTASKIREAGIPVKDVSEITGFPEMMDGRVKTLHPLIHAGILERSDLEEDQQALARIQAQPIDLIVVNLYPFLDVVAGKEITLPGDSSDSSMPLEKAIEYIDIGGPSMIRAAAKNMIYKAVLSHPDQYQACMQEIQQSGGVSFKTRVQLAQEAFEHTAVYDHAIQTALADALQKAESHTSQGGLDGAERHTSQENQDSVAKQNLLAADLKMIGQNSPTWLRYGENPHQMAAVLGNPDSYIDCFHGKELSYNNYLDLDAALRLMADFKDDQPTTAILKHTVPCGVATANSLSESWTKAFATDRTSPFGGVIVMNTELDLRTAEELDEIFSEIVAAPSFSSEAETLLRQKKNRRLVRIKRWPDNSTQSTTIFAGRLLQQTDQLSESIDDLICVTERKPSEEELKKLWFAWRVVKHVKSNAIVFAGDNCTLGIGTGQTSRIRSTEIAAENAKHESLSLHDSVVASDAFFPFADGLLAAASYGATAVIQPGGSVRDEEVIQAANEKDIAMVFTVKRHFRH